MRPRSFSLIEGKEVEISTKSLRSKTGWKESGGERQTLKMTSECFKTVEQRSAGNSKKM